MVSALTSETVLALTASAPGLGTGGMRGLKARGERPGR
jgi:hypothetical protein